MARTFDWGCGCGRLCSAEDVECDACDGPRSAGKPLENEAARKRFLKRAERNDGRALHGAAGVYHRIERSYLDTAAELDRAYLGTYGDLLAYLEPSADYGEEPLWIPDC